MHPVREESLGDILGSGSVEEMAIKLVDADHIHMGLYNIGTSWNLRIYIAGTESIKEFDGTIRNVFEEALEWVQSKTKSNL